MDEIRQLLLIEELNVKQAQIKKRLDKGKDNYTKEDMINAMIDDKEVKILLDKCKDVCSK